MNALFYYLEDQLKGPALPMEQKNCAKKFRFLFACVTPRLPMNVCKKKFSPIRSSRLVGQREHIHKCLVLLYRRKHTNKHQIRNPKFQSSTNRRKEKLQKYEFMILQILQKKCPPWISRSSDRDVEYPKFSVLLKQIVKV